MSKHPKIVRRLPPEELRFVCQEKTVLGSVEAEPLTGMVGQDRAMEALKFGLELRGSHYKDSHYGIFVVGPEGTGRTSKTIEYVRRYVSTTKHDLKDICFVYNFQNPNEPTPLVLPPEGSLRLNAKLTELQEVLGTKVKNIFEEITKKTQKLMVAEINTAYQEILSELKKMNLVAIPDADGVYIRNYSLQNPSDIITNEEYSSLDVETQNRLDQAAKDGAGIYNKYTEKNIEIQKKYTEQADKEKKEYLGRNLKTVFDGIAVSLEKENCGLRDFFAGLKKYIEDNSDKIIEKKKPVSDNPFALSQAPNENTTYLPFKVNTLASHKVGGVAPVINVRAPKYEQFYGSVEYKNSGQNTLFADHTTINAGAVIKASGGYLIVDGNDLLQNGCWPKLKEVMKSGFLKIQGSRQSVYGPAIIGGLNPQKIPISIKIILVGDQRLYNIFSAYDQDFPNLFRVPAHFEESIKFDDAGLKSYAGFVALVSKQENLLPVSRGAVAKIVEYGLRLSEKNGRISARFGKIKDLIIEANFWAKNSNDAEIKEKHIILAIAKNNSRNGWYEDYFQERVSEGSQIIETAGKKVGQINGLVVHTISGNVAFGLPSKITSRAFVGNGGVVSVQRNIRKLSGPIHDLGVEILSGYLSGTYARKTPLSLTAKICFEQSYGGVDGDSATMAETVAIISAITDLPVKQSLAITGSMNQHGEVQPIGGVNQKIEGFFDVVKKRGLNGSHGVLIPIQNASQLQLKEEIVEAVSNKMFHIFTYTHIDSALEMFLDRPAEQIHALVMKKTREIKKNQKKSSKE